jgi:hypothetical protein
MSPNVSERSFEEAIECGLLQHGPDACAGEFEESATGQDVTPLANARTVSAGLPRNP